VSGADNESWEFWARLARRVNAVFRASRDNNIRFLWVNDILAPTAPLQQRPASMITSAFVSEGAGKTFVQYRVNLFFTEGAVSAYHNGERSRILPDPDAMDWVRISRTEKEITIDIAPGDSFVAQGGWVMAASGQTRNSSR
jgi:hypothetical protein